MQTRQLAWVAALLGAASVCLAFVHWPTAVVALAASIEVLLLSYRNFIRHEYTRTE